MQKKFIDNLGRKWFAAQIIKSPVQIENGDWILFNEEMGFQVILNHIFEDIFSLSEDIINNDDEFVEVETAKVVDNKNEQIF